MRLLLGISLVLAGLAANAHPTGSSSIDCRKLWDLERELGCFAYHPTPVDSAVPQKKEFVMESQFGPSQCKASNTVDAAKKELKTECDGWIKERKADLGTKFRTGTCNAKCDPCGSGLERCMTTGLVHYSDTNEK